MNRHPGVVGDFRLPLGTGAGSIAHGLYSLEAGNGAHTG